MIKTVMTTMGVNAINFGNTADRYYWCKNIGETTLYVSVKEDISPDADDVAILESGDIVMIETYNQDIYVLGEGKIQIYESDTPVCPFKSRAKGGEGGSSSQGLVLLKQEETVYTATSSYTFLVDNFNISDYKMFVCIINRIGSVAFTPEMTAVKFCGDSNNIYQVQWVRDNMFEIKSISETVLSYFSYQLFGIKG